LPQEGGDETRPHRSSLGATMCRGWP